jgi:hypothetical protein
MALCPLNGAYQLMFLHVANDNSEICRFLFNLFCFHAASPKAEGIYGIRLTEFRAQYYTLRQGRNQRENYLQEACRGLLPHHEKGKQPQEAQNAQNFGAMRRNLVPLAPFVVSPEIPSGNKMLPIGSKRTQKEIWGDNLPAATTVLNWRRHQARVYWKSA